MKFRLYKQYHSAKQNSLYAVILVVGDDACLNCDFQDASRGKRAANNRWNTESAVLDSYFNNWTYLGRVHEHAFPDKHNPLHRAGAENGRYSWVTMIISPRTKDISVARKMFEEAENAYFSSRRRAFGVYDFSTKRFVHTDLEERGHYSTLTTNTAKAFDTSSLRIEGQEKEEELIDLLFEVYPEEMQRWRGRFSGKKFGF